MRFYEIMFDYENSKKGDMVFKQIQIMRENTALNNMIYIK